MAQDSKNDTTAPTKSRVETEIQVDEVTSADIGTGNVSDGGAVRTTNTDAESYEFGKEAAPKDGSEEHPKDGNQEEPEAEAGEGDEAAASDADDLGDWKRDDPEVQAKFEERYFTKEGQLNKDVLSKEFWASHAKDPKKAGLKDATYEFLKDTLGITKEVAKEIESALVVKATAEAQTFFKNVGGQERFEAAVKWGREGGYTPAQRERFNKARDAGGIDFEEAVEALMARYNRINPPRQSSEGRRGPPQQRRQSSPQRNVTGGAAEAGGGAQDGFKTREEYQQAWQTALAAEKAAAPGQAKREARAKLDDLRRKARRSRFA